MIVYGIRDEKTALLTCPGAVKHFLTWDICKIAGSYSCVAGRKMASGKGGIDAEIAFFLKIPGRGYRHIFRSW